MRAVFRRFHGGAYGTFEVRKNLRRGLKLGVFAGDSYPLWMRFSSDTIPIGPDLGQICGVGIKLFGVPGKKVEEKSALTQDFLLQNIDRFFVKNVQELCEDSIDDEKFRREHPATDEILKKMDHRVGSVLHVPYWSCLPSRFGSDMYAKYKLEPHDAIDRPPKKAASGYLKNDLTRRLAAGEARFGFYLQLFKDNARTPLDDGTAVWSERVSPPVEVATIVLPAQDIEARGQAEYVDNLAFSPWHTLPEHEPYGDLQEVRRKIYPMSATVRHWMNGVPNEEPSAPRGETPPDLRP